MSLRKNLWVILFIEKSFILLVSPKSFENKTKKLNLWINREKENLK